MWKSRRTCEISKGRWKEVEKPLLLFHLFPRARHFHGPPASIIIVPQIDLRNCMTFGIWLLSGWHGTRPLQRQGPDFGDRKISGHQALMFRICHARLPLSSAPDTACRSATFPQNRFRWMSAFADSRIAKKSFICVSAVITGNATVLFRAVILPANCNIVPLPPNIRTPPLGAAVTPSVSALTGSANAPALKK
jgi:hypothetical protein